MKKDLGKIILLSITGDTEDDWRNKLDEINSLGIDTIALFLETYRLPQRKKIYKALDASCVTKTPLVHIKNDMTKSELKYLCQKYDNPCLTIHESSFDKLSKWRGYHKQLYLEMNYNDSIPENVDVEKIGGFCIDFAHFKAAEEKMSKEFKYVASKQTNDRLFKCNHLNGYSYKDNWDLHTITSLSEFEYLKTLPSYVFGDIIALEVSNSISEQIKFRKYLIKLLSGIY